MEIRFFNPFCLADRVLLAVANQPIGSSGKVDASASKHGDNSLSQSRRQAVNDVR